MRKFLITSVLMSLAFTAHANDDTAREKYSVECILEFVAKEMNVELKKDVPLPKVHYSGSTDLAFFNEAMIGQWGMKSEVITNAYSFSHNVIFLIDEAAYYQKMGRYIDDSLAHELVHFIQIKHKWGPPLDDASEMDAVAVQTEFRKQVMINQAVRPCAASGS